MITATRTWLYDHPLDLKRTDMDDYYSALRDEWTRRHPSGVTPSAPQDQPIKLAINTPIVFSLDRGDDSLLGTTLARSATGTSLGVPVGAQVMGNEYFGGGSYVFNFPMKRELPIRWDLGFNPRGLQAEPLITSEFYAPLNPEVLPPGFPAADI